MKSILATIAALALALPAVAQVQPTSCLRTMPLEELIRTSILIARIKVKKTERARYRGEFGQLATLVPLDVIDGDFTLKEINVLAHSSVRCAEDNYDRDSEMLVFLEPEDSLFRTVNFQYGQFLIVGNVVKGWRDKGKSCDKPYGEVREEILRYLTFGRRPSSQPPPVQPPKPPES
jgi:hypothetical protein